MGGHDRRDWGQQRCSAEGQRSDILHELRVSGLPIQWEQQKEQKLLNSAGTDAGSSFSSWCTEIIFGGTGLGREWTLSSEHAAQ